MSVIALTPPITAENASLIQLFQHLGRGRVLASAWLDNSIFSVNTPAGTWEYATSGEEARTLNFNWKMPGIQIIYSPQMTLISADGTKQITAHEDGAVSIHEILSGKELMRRENTAEKLFSLSPDEQWLAALTHENDVSLIHLDSGRVHRFQHGHRYEITGIYINSETGHLTTSCSFDRSIRLWDVATGQLERTLPYGGFPVISHNGRYIGFSHSLGNEVNKIWITDIETGQEVSQVSGLHLLATRFSQDNRHLLTRTITIESPTLANIRQSAVEVATGKLHDIYQTTYNAEEMTSFVAPTTQSWQFGIRQLPDAIQVIEPTTGIIRLNIKINAPDLYHSYFYSDDNRLFVLPGRRDINTDVIQVWNIFTGHCEAEFAGENYYPLTLSEDNRFLVIHRGGYKPPLIAEVRSGRIYGELDVLHLLNFVFTKHSQLLIATGQDDGIIHIYRLPDLERVCRFRAHNTHIQVLKLIADDTIIASSGKDGVVRLWSIPAV